MTTRNKQKAQGIIIIILLLIIGFFVLFMLISAFSAKRASPIIKEANWQIVIGSRVARSYRRP